MEGYGPSTYGDHYADVYDDWYAGLSDVEATVERVAALARAAGGDRVLERGGGSGRLALALAAAGLDTWSLDASRAMVRRLRAKPDAAHVRAVVGDMARLPFRPQRPTGHAGDAGDAGDTRDAFAVVLCAFNTLFNLTSAEALGRCLGDVAGVLAPSGRFVVEAFVPPPGGEADPPVTAVEPRQIALDEVVLAVSRLDPATRTITGQHVHITESGIRLRPWVLHYASPGELDDLASGVGLRLDERSSGWRGEPFDDTSRTHVSTYVRRPAPQDAP
jgi:SAM-dependent methyltransferase